MLSIAPVERSSRTCTRCAASKLFGEMASDEAGPSGDEKAQDPSIFVRVPKNQGSHPIVGLPQEWGLSWECVSALACRVVLLLVVAGTLLP